MMRLSRHGRFVVRHRRMMTHPVMMVGISHGMMTPGGGLGARGRGRFGMRLGRR